jgi:hypothetical protein
MNTSRTAPSWLPPGITRATSPFRDQLAAYQKHGSGSCTEVHERRPSDETTGTSQTRAAPRHSCVRRSCSREPA